MTEPIPFAMGRSGLVVVISPDRLRAACVVRGWSLSDLAAHAKVSRPTLRSALLGRPVRPRTAWRLARALNESSAPVDLHEIMAAS